MDKLKKNDMKINHTKLCLNSSLNSVTTIQSAFIVLASTSQSIL